MIRKLIFGDELGRDEYFPETLKNSNEKYILATIATDKNKTIPIGSLRFFINGPREIMISRVGVLKEFRGHGIGKDMMQLTENIIFNSEDYSEFENIILESRFERVEFYEKIGYHAIGDFFLTQNYPHINMIKNIPSHLHKDPL
ncbi:UPF0039 protein YybD [Smittium mucronatum]|uniref:UPF0039 protein YybD n=1 Tax=Smittium mucronatum TaxID=133383 RepID=A0A1R0GRS4_9FUNG|nr:UPF0039 protein YybD [Smittium mucronatum]